MSDDEDDYLSDKFLTASNPTTSAPKTYAQLRKEAEKKSSLKNVQNKTKSRRQRELEAREEGLSKSLFERAKEEEDAGISSGNKALSMMMKMGFKPGQALGKVNDPPEQEIDVTPQEASQSADDSRSSAEPTTSSRSMHIASGKKGIGSVKRARSPSTAAERVAKMAKMAKEAEEISHQDYRNRARREYEEKRAEGRLGLKLDLAVVPAQRTCVTLDEQAGKTMLITAPSQFHVLWLNPNRPESFPEGLLAALALRGATGLPRENKEEPIQVRLRKQMQADALRPLDEDDASTVTKNSALLADSFSTEVVEEAIQFLRLQAQDRLSLVLAYLRDQYAYCFWCGVQYDDEETMDNQCPGPDEDSHD
ncbi:hypothetical protein H0H92_004847 [Tricholoma furcatifolium]|nr:hypothetical protein H0H92_004847 [Tricholoma furcatifolium]